MLLVEWKGRGWEDMQIFLPYFLVPYSQTHFYVTSFLLPLLMPHCPFSTLEGFFSL